MAGVSLRPAQSSDWPAILALANAALPWDAAGNLEWLENRKQFDGRRRHYVAETLPSHRAVGYGAVEEGPDPRHFRIFVVMDPALLPTEVGEILYARLTADLVTLEAEGVWAREYAADQDILTFLAGKGFVERERFAPPGRRAMALLAKRF